MKKILCLLLCLSTLLSLAPVASSYEIGEPYQFDLSGFLKNEKRCNYVEMMLDYHLRTNSAVQQTLKDGYVALFFFEGCSDNMDHPDLSDISYYRVSAVCVAVKLNEDGKPYIIFFNENCSTLPDRPLEYGTWYLDEVGVVGPATICDGTYELYSVRHGGVYEALHLRTSEDDGSIDAVYMHPDGYTYTRATEINIHTRTGNHTIKGAMWSAGCLLVGDGDWGQFAELIASTYYSVYKIFDLGKRVGTVTINRQMLKDKLHPLYEDSDAIDRILANSRQELPESYLRRCTQTVVCEKPRMMQTAAEAQLMTLPCSNITDARSTMVATLSKGETIEVLSCIQNPLGNLWYELEYNGQRCYLYSSYAQEVTSPSWFEQFWDAVFG